MREFTPASVARIFAPLAAEGLWAQGVLTSAGLGALATEAIISGTGAAAFRREGELTWENQLNVADRLIDGAIAAGTGVGLLKLAQTSAPVFQALIRRFERNPSYPVKTI